MAISRIGGVVSLAEQKSLCQDGIGEAKVLHKSNRLDLNA